VKTASKFSWILLSKVGSRRWGSSNTETDQKSGCDGKGWRAIGQAFFEVKNELEASHRIEDR
jgi:hypothetical protein